MDLNVRAYGGEILNIQNRQPEPAPADLWRV